MATAISFFRFVTPRPPSPLKNSHRPLNPPVRLVPAAPSLRRNPPIFRRHFSAQENNGGAEENLADKKEKGTEKEEEKPVAVEAKIQEMMAARKEKRSKVDELLGGVAEEVREIEWPEFRKVLGTTGVVLAVIAGSSVALLTVNTILAELSDRVFAGKGVQDFFG